ncbi:MAG TPA: G1 family glutamic endopeptidase, partial [Acidimicrobiales bacterium]|nr:G1 family glutamic endopeptidase [Acidimicrobiales bacterium]
MITDRRHGRGRAAGLLLALATATGAVAAAAVPSPPAGAAGPAHAAALPAGFTPRLASHPFIPAPGRAHVASGACSFPPSLNWSGYVECGAQPFTSVSAQWVVPTVQTAPDDEATGTWIGIDGVDNQTLIQTGTAQESVGGQTQYYAWWETLPAFAQPLWPVS